MLFLQFPDPLRLVGALLLPTLIWIGLGRYFVNFMKNWQKNGQPIRDLGPESHKKKSGTPTMGGVMLVFNIILSALIFTEDYGPYLLSGIFVLLIFGILGFLDDLAKIKKNNHIGIRPRGKLLIQILGSLAILLALRVYAENHSNFAIWIPFAQNFILNLGYLYPIFACIVIIGSSNAVNLTDGIDGLASTITTISFSALLLICLLIGAKLGHPDYFLDNFSFDSSKLSQIVILCLATIGSCIGFLWFNTCPARIFMGDTGSLALGALFGAIGVMLNIELLIALIGIIFVIETLSVILQVGYFKYTRGKRIFLMTPIHHHFEKLGMQESEIVTKFAIVTFISSIFAILSVY
ncbi:MAG: phospho-N-acetylmuramoyl-pentapeptide-transferase [Rickettsiaceae bacterium]|nr:phospho-N-acetylmuramoyl-pentapeptide-transferase [Rickettsiaceae bacterium]